MKGGLQAVCSVTFAVLLVSSPVAAATTVQSPTEAEATASVTTGADLAASFGSQCREINGHKYCLTDVWAESDQVRPGETVTIKAIVENEGSKTGTINTYLGVRPPGEAKSYPDGQKKYDIAVGERVTLEYQYRVPESNPTGEYEVTVDVWTGNDAEMFHSSGWQQVVEVTEPTTSARITDIDPDTGTYEAGQEVDTRVTVENTGDTDHTFHVGYSVRDPNGDWWDNDGTTHESITLAPGERDTVTVEWAVEENAPEGEYGVWTALYTDVTSEGPQNRIDDANDQGVFAVSEPNRNPTASRDAPNRDSTIEAGESLRFSIDADDPDGNLDGVEWYVDDEFRAATGLSGGSDDGDWSATFDDPGTYTVEAVAFDGNNAYSDAVSWTVTVEQSNQNPTASRDTPNRDTTVESGESLRFAIDADDPDGNLDGVEWYVDDEFKEATGLSGSEDTGDWEPAFDDPGTYTVEAVAFDENNAYSDAVSWTVTVEEPTVISARITDFETEPGAYTAGDVVQSTVEVENTGNTDHTFHVGYSVRDPNGDWWDNDGTTHESITLAPGERDTVTVEWNVEENAPEGEYGVWTALYTDVTSEGPQNRIDDANDQGVFAVSEPNRNPTASRDAPNGDSTIEAGESLRFSIEADDPDGNLDGVEWYVDDEFRAATGLSGGSDDGDWSATFDDPGTYTVEAVAFDENNAYSDTVSWTVTVEEPTDISAKITDFETEPGAYTAGETVQSTVEVENTGNTVHTFYVGYSVRDPNGSWRDNGGTTHESITLAPGERDTVTVAWDIEDDAPGGEYDVWTTLYRGQTGDDLENRTDEANDASVFSVSEPNRNPTASRKSPDGEVSAETGESTRFSIEADDPDGNLDGVEWYVDDEFKEATGLSGGSDGGGWAPTFDNPGTYTVEAVAFDENNAYSDAISWTVTVEEPTEISAKITDLETEPGAYTTGDVVQSTVEVENTGNTVHTFYVGYSVRDPNGSWRDNGGTTHESITLAPGERDTVTVAWDIEDDAPGGEYDVWTTLYRGQTGDDLENRTDEANDASVFSVSEPNRNPTASRESPDGEISIESGESVAFTLAADDPDGNLDGIEWYVDETLETTQSVNGTNATPATTIAFDDPGTYVVEGIVFDRERTYSEAVEWIVTVEAGNVPPNATLGEQQSERSVRTGEEAAFNVTADDGNGNVAGIEWYVDDELVAETQSINGSEATGTRSFTFDEPGEHTVEAVVFDSQRAYSSPVVWDVSVERTHTDAQINGVITDRTDLRRGDEISTTVVVENTGNVAATFGLNTSIIGPAETAFAPGSARRNLTLVPDERAEVRLDWNVPETAREGDYDIVAAVRNGSARTTAQSALAERRQTDAFAVSVENRTRVRINAIEVGSETYARGDTAEVTATIENTGTVRSRFHVTHHIVGPQGRQFEDDGTDRSMVLAPGVNETVRLEWQIGNQRPSGQYGTVLQVWNTTSTDGSARALATAARDTSYRVRPGELGIRVTDGQDPFENVSVELYGPERRQSRTSEFGSVTVPELESGQYTVFVSGPKLANDVRRDITFNASSGLTITAERADPVPISGAVVTEDGRPVEDAEIDVVVTRLGSLSDTLTVSTDTDGRFSFADEFDPGSGYDVEVKIDGRVFQVRRVIPDRGGWNGTIRVPNHALAGREAEENAGQWANASSVKEAFTYGQRTVVATTKAGIFTGVTEDRYDFFAGSPAQDVVPSDVCAETRQTASTECLARTNDMQERSSIFSYAAVQGFMTGATNLVEGIASVPDAIVMILDAVINLPDTIANIVETAAWLYANPGALEEMVEQLPQSVIEAQQQDNPFPENTDDQELQENYEMFADAWYAGYVTFFAAETAASGGAGRAVSGSRYATRLESGLDSARTYVKSSTGRDRISTLARTRDRDALDDPAEVQGYHRLIDETPDGEAFRSRLSDDELVLFLRLQREPGVDQDDLARFIDATGDRGALFVKNAYDRDDPDIVRQLLLVDERAGANVDVEEWRADIVEKYAASANVDADVAGITTSSGTDHRVFADYVAAVRTAQQRSEIRSVDDYVDTVANQDTLSDDGRALYRESQIVNPTGEAWSAIHYARRPGVEAIEQDWAVPGTDSDLDLRLERADGRTEYVEVKNVNSRRNRQANMRDDMFSERLSNSMRNKLDGADPIDGDVSVEFVINDQSTDEIRDEIEAILGNHDGEVPFDEVRIRDGARSEAVVRGEITADGEVRWLSDGSVAPTLAGPAVTAVDGESARSPVRRPDPAGPSAVASP